MDAVKTSEELGERIREARVAAGVSQAKLAERLDVDRSALVRIEAGERKVSAVELFTIAEVLDFPLSHFVYPPSQTVVSARRELSEDDSLIAKKRYKADVDLQAFLRDAEWLLEHAYLRPAEMPKFSLGADSESARAAAVQVRRQLAVTGPIEGMVAFAELVGLYVRALSSLKDDGGSLTPRLGFGVAIVGSGQEPGRRRFTVAHEIGHHLLGDEYSSDVGVAASRDEREALIDAFAAELLVPQLELRSRWEQFEGSILAKDRLVQLAGEYRVSWSSLLDSACRAGVLDGKERRALRAQTPVKGDFLRLLGQEPTPDVLPKEMGPTWRRAVMRAYTDGRITRARTAELLLDEVRDSDLPDLGLEPPP